MFIGELQDIKLRQKTPDITLYSISNYYYFYFAKQRRKVKK